MGILDIRRLRVDFLGEGAPLRAVRGIDLSVGEGEVLALVGESGSGKSVTSKAILGLLPPSARITDGEIYYLGRNILALPERERARLRGREISMVPQDPFLSLDPITRVGEQIAESVRVPQGLSRREAREYRRRRATERRSGPAPADLPPCGAAARKKSSVPGDQPLLTRSA